jgi:hypothetical protein
MKKLLFIFTLAAICTVLTSSFKPIQSANDGFKQTILVVADDLTEAPEDVRKEEKKKKKSPAPACCLAKTQKVECTEAQQNKCAAVKPNCPVEKKCPKK